MRSSLLLAMSALLAGTSATTPVSCQAGYGIKDGTCQECLVGTYSAGGSNAVCTTCPGGSTTQNEGSTAASDCQCAPGSYTTYGFVGGKLTITACPACGPGTYQNDYGKLTCTHCASGDFASQSGSTSCCPCCVGYYSTYTLGDTAGPTSCAQCPTSNGHVETTSGTESTSASDCKVYTAGKPYPPSTCTESQPNTCPATTGTAPTGALGRRKRSLLCRPGYKRCPHWAGRGGEDCVDVANDPETCGGCTAPEGMPTKTKGEIEYDGKDCTAIPNVSSTSCQKGQCIIERCRRGYFKLKDASGEMACIKRSLQLQSQSSPMGVSLRSNLTSGIYP